MRNMATSVLIILTTTCMGFDAKEFADDYKNTFDYAKDINAKKRRLQSEHIVDFDRITTDLQNYYAVGSLSKVKYSIKVKDDTFLYGRNVFTEKKCKGIEEDVRRYVVSTLKEYGVTETKTTALDVPFIDVDVCIRNDSQVLNAIWIEAKVVVRRTLLDPVSKRPITAPVWEKKTTLVYTKQSAHLLVTKDHPDLVEKIMHDVDTLIFLLSWSQYRTITTMKAVIQSDKEGYLPESFSEYVIK